MKQLAASFIIIFFLLLYGGKSSAQYNTSAFYIKTYTAADGLPDSYVLSIYQDRQQYIWVGTYSGLSRFDGKSFTNYGIKNGLPDLYVSAISQDEQNRIWIGTLKGLGYLLNNTYTQATIDDNQSINFVFSFNYVVKNKLWAFTSHGLYELNGNTWTKKKPVKGYENTSCRYAIAKDDCIYYCYPDDIFKVKPDGSVSLVVHRTDKAGPSFIQFRDAGDKFFTSTPNGLMEIKDGQLIPVYDEHLNKQMIYGFFPDSKKRLWVSTDKDGLFVSAPGNEKELLYRVPLTSNLISNFFEDMNGNMWIADFHGLTRIKSAFFDVLTPQTPGMLSRYFTLSSMGSSFYVFANMYGLYEYKNDIVERKHFPDQNNVLDKNAEGAEVIDAICNDNEKNFWAVTRARRLLKISPDGHEKQIYPSGIADTSSLVYFVTSNAINNDLYFCGKKLFIYHNGTINEFRSKQQNAPIVNSWKAVGLRNGNVLVNSRTSGFWLVKLSGEAYSLSKTSGIPATTRLTFTEDHSGHIWLSYPGSGILRYYWENDSTLKKETEITTKNALPNDVIEALAVDGKNRLWAATLSGLVVLDSLAGRSDKNYFIYHVGKDQGLNFAISSGLTRLTTDINGDIWFGSNDIVVRFRTNELKTQTDAPLTHIESVVLNMQETDWHQWVDSLDGPFMLPYKLTLPYNQRTLTFTFKGLNFDTDEDTWYSHRLIGVDSSWMPPTKNNVFSFIRLSPGTFTFEVRSRRTNSEWSDPVSFTFTIKPPFWQTWWFRSIGIAIASFILFLIFRTQLKRVNRKAALENQLRSLEMKALKAQMNPHFVYNALNSIQSLVIDNRQEEALDYMVKFSRLLRQVLNHSEQNVVTLEKEMDTLKLYIQLESLRLHYSLNYSIEVDENIITEKESIPPLVLQPFVENALWHGLGEKEGDKKLIIQVRSDDDWLLFRIEDNGIGRFNGKQTKSLSYQEGPRGMEITINRINAYNEDKNNHSITIEDKMNPDGSSAGTAVDIRIRRK